MSVDFEGVGGKSQMTTTENLKKFIDYSDESDKRVSGWIEYPSVVRSVSGEEFIEMELDGQFDVKWLIELGKILEKEGYGK